MTNNRADWSSVAQYTALTKERVDAILAGIGSLKAGVIGDGCLDVYWHVDMTLSELSRETPHHNLPVVRESCFPGAAANVAMNFRDLGCAEVRFCTVIGEDWRGRVLLDALLAAGINVDAVMAERGRVTPAYCKTIRHGLQDVQQEDARLDFVNGTELPAEATERFLRLLDSMAQEVDVICVTDQLRGGVINDAVRERLRYWANAGKMIVVDSRNRIGSYNGMILKPNEIEALRWFNGNQDFGQPKPDELVRAGLQLARKAGAPCCITLGEQGALWLEDGECTFVPTVPQTGPIDIVGAGDTFATCLISALGTGSGGPEAAAFAHLGSSVSIQKLGRTGTATPAELLQQFEALAKRQTNGGRSA
ncbi:bifunctional heptose 7-phosphate kinase/heptose 1-phosphate adenyltransferase [Paenibacillus cymbidii]|uniref:bifunctional heptose 7-phosphate kinase/heptose 1-phosphate adenyltransferase n=1 Tax=Paenibacillus cymbidii TaxID=1639034 RepID=UPI0010821C74|nr:PfkB family carbohydrate kinase [Paenibacillus cymbidii]